jgi:hypothetical protein
MWNWFNCYVSGRHDYGLSSHSGAMFLECTHCGRRSSGWAVETIARKPVREAPRAKQEPGVTSAPVVPMPAATARILPFAPRDRRVTQERPAA